jgi:hypothetical protein
MELVHRVSRMVADVPVMIPSLDARRACASRKLVHLPYKVGHSRASIWSGCMLTLQDPCLWHRLVVGSTSMGLLMTVPTP